MKDDARITIAARALELLGYQRIVIVACEKCGQMNRIDAARAFAYLLTPRCGSCRTSLVDSGAEVPMPITVDARQLN